MKSFTVKTMHTKIFQHTTMISAPESQPLAVQYNIALAEVLRLLPDKQLAELSVNINTKLANRPSCSSPDALNLAAQKVETEAIERWNRRDSGNVFLECVLSGSLFMPGEDEGNANLYLCNEYHH